MPSGKIYSGILPASTDVDTGAVPAGMVRTVSITLVNLGVVAVTASVYVSTSATPADADRIEPDFIIPANGGLYKLTGEVVGAGERVVLFTDGAAVTARVSGFEEFE